MPYDPTIPQPLTPIDADQIREQLNALHDEILAIPAGPEGPQGPPGEQGPPGPVTVSDLNDAIATTARNPSNLTPLTQTISDPPSQAEVQAIQTALNDLLATLFRPPT